MNLRPGAQLDELILNKVFGQTKAAVGFMEEYSTQINSARKILKQMSDMGYYFDIRPMPSEKIPGFCSCHVLKNNTDVIHIVNADSEPLVICLAAIKTLGLDI